MKQTIVLSMTLLFSASLFLANAAPKDEVTQAAKKLEQAGGYTWKVTWETSRGSSSPTVGKISKDGLIHLTLTFGDNNRQVIMKGDKGAMETQDGWQSFAELEGNGDQPSRGRFMARMMRNMKAPAVQAQDLAKNAEGLELADGAYSGALSEAGVKEMLTFRGRSGSEGPSISNAKGSVKFWIKDGLLAKFQYQLQGTMTFNNNDRDIDRTTTVDISNVGSTKVDVPAGAKAKLN